jgi:hypothetical protein
MSDMAAENAVLRRVIAEHSRYLMSMLNAYTSAPDAVESNFFDASVDLYARLAEAGFGDLDDQQRMHQQALIDGRDYIRDAEAAPLEQLPAEPAPSA